MIRNGDTFFTPFDIEDFIEKYNTIERGIILKNDISFDLNKKNLNIIIFIIKNFGFRIIRNIRFI